MDNSSENIHLNKNIGKNNSKTGLIRALMEDSKKLRAARGEDFFSEKSLKTPSIVPLKELRVMPGAEDISMPGAEGDFRKIRETHVKLNHLIVEYSQAGLGDPFIVVSPKKKRSKSVHLYLDASVEDFLKKESLKSDTKWNLRKKAGLGSLIAKFIENFIELKARESIQTQNIHKIIDDFRLSLVDFKKTSGNPNEYLKTEKYNQKMRELSNDMGILLPILGFNSETLKKCIGMDQYKWVEFILNWNTYSSK